MEYEAQDTLVGVTVLPPFCSRPALVVAAAMRLLLYEEGFKNVDVDSLVLKRLPRDTFQTAR